MPVLALRISLDFRLCFSGTDMGWGFLFVLRFLIWPSLTTGVSKETLSMAAIHKAGKQALRFGRAAFSSMLIGARNAVHDPCWPTPLRMGKV